MRFFSLLTLALPALVLGIARPVTLPAEDTLAARDASSGMSTRHPLPEPEDIPEPLSDLEIRELLNQRQLDLSDLSGLLANLSASFNGIAQLLSPDSIGNIKIVVDGLADVLKSPGHENLKNVVTIAANLLGSKEVSSLITSLPSLLGSVTGLLTPTLISNVTDILGSAHILLTPKFASETVGLIDDVAPVSSLSTPFTFETKANRDVAGFRDCTSHIRASVCCIWNIIGGLWGREMWHDLMKIVHSLYT
jgi:hypothetical protein